MARFGFCGPSYESQSVSVDAQRTMNWYVEAAGVESPMAATTWALYPRPGLKTFATVPSATGGIGTLYTFNKRCFGTASSGQFFELTSAGVIINEHAIAADPNPTQLAANNVNQLIVESAGTLYLFNLSTNAFAPVTAPPVGPAAFVDFLDGYFIALVPDHQAFQYSNLEDGNTWDAADIAQINEFSETPISMLVAHRDIWFWTLTRAVVYTNTGDPLNPFQPIPGTFIEQGISAPYSPICLDNNVFWLGAHESGEGMAWVAQGWVPRRISTHAVETAWQRYSTMSDAISYGYQLHGHFFWSIYFPTANATWTYDIDSGMWNEEGYWTTPSGQPTQYVAHRARCHAFAFDQHLVGDWMGARIFSMSPAYQDDDGNPIRRFRRAPHIVAEQEWTFHHKLRVDLETGLGPQPPLTGSPEGLSDLILHDANGNNWLVTIQDNGVPSSQNLGPGLAQLPYIFVDMAFYPYQITCYTLSIDTGGNLFLIPPSPPPALPIVTGFQKRLFMITPDSLQTDLSVVDGNLTIEPPAVPSREPQIMLRYSDDGGHSWSNEYMLGCGMSGDFRKRVEWRGLGRTRDRVYEISVTDPVPWCIRDSYLFATPGYEPTERYLSRIGKMA